MKKHKPKLYLKTGSAAAVIFAFLACSRVTSDTGTEIRIGDTMPEFSVIDDRGDKVTSEELSMGTALIAFFNTGCEDCRAELPVLESAYEFLRSSGIRFLLISREEDAPSVEHYWNENGLTLPYSAQKNRKVYELFAQSEIPRIYIFHEGVLTAAFKTRINWGILMSALPYEIEFDMTTKDSERCASCSWAAEWNGQYGQVAFPGCTHPDSGPRYVNLLDEMESCPLNDETN